MLKIFKAIKMARLYEEANKHFNAGEYEQALHCASQVEGVEEYEGKRTLLEANIYHRMMDYPKSIGKYRCFLSEDQRKIRNADDRRYLLAYSEYFLDKVLVKSGTLAEFSITPDSYRLLARRASMLTKAEFPPP